MRCGAKFGARCAALRADDREKRRVASHGVRMGRHIHADGGESIGHRGPRSRPTDAFDVGKSHHSLIRGVGAAAAATRGVGGGGAEDVSAPLAGLGDRADTADAS